MGPEIAGVVAGGRVRVRPALFLVETVLALAILVACLACLSKMTLWTRQSHEEARARHAALQTAANVLEQASAIPWEQLGPEWARSVQLPNWAEEVLADGRVTVEVKPLEGQLAAKLVRVTVSYDSRAVGGRRSVELVAVRSAKSVKVRAERSVPGPPAGSTAAERSQQRGAPTEKKPTDR